MSGLTGKKNSTLKKEQVKENKLLSTGVKSIKFWHEASAGETSIPFGSLSLPTDILNQGLTNPTSTEILAANLAFFHTNVEVFSSLNQKLMEGLTYVVKNSQIKFVNGYEATEGEIFEVNYKNDVVTGTNVVDARPLTATGVLTAGDVDFAVGEAFKTNAYPAHQIGEVLVFVDGEIQYRNVGNATAGASADGNYQEVHSSNGFGSIIRFNESFLDDKNIVVMSRNLIAERPDISMMQFIESLGGQLDTVIDTVAALAGVPETDFQVAPNQVDLKAFGDQVITNRQAIAANALAITTKQDAFQIDWQKKTLTTTLTVGSGTSAELSFSNLELNKTYRVSGMILAASSGNINVNWQLENNGINLFNAVHKDTSGAEEATTPVNTIFTAQATTLNFNYAVTSGNINAGSASFRATFLILEELPNHNETGKWS